MPKRHPNYRHVKIHRSYTVEDIACLFHIHKNTVRGWLKAGLQTLDVKRPTLVLGQALADFLRVRREKSKHPCCLGEMYCLKCRQPTIPAGRMVDHLNPSETVAQLRGMCPVCFCMMYQKVSVAKLELIRTTFAVTFPQARPQVSNTTETSLNSDFR